jgi:DNA-binding transcriptional regulator YhcF (GntR family)
MRVQRDSGLPLYEQVAAEIRRAISEGEAQPGERLAPAVDIAGVLGVNKNTVIRALHQLRDDGILEFTRGRGIRVVGTPQRVVVLDKVDELVRLARRYGMRREEVIALVNARA